MSLKSLLSRRARYTRSKHQKNSTIVSLIKITLSTLLTVGITSGIIYAASITSVTTQTISSGDTIGAGWYQAVNNKITNIYGSGGNVGIGTATPGYLFDIQSSTAGGVSRLKTSAAGGSATFILDRGSISGGNASQIHLSTNGTSDWTFGTSVGAGGVSNMSIYNYGLGANALTVLKSNNSVGIGTTSPTAKLEVAGNIIAADPTATNHVATKAYVDAKVSAAGGIGGSYVIYMDAGYVGYPSYIFGSMTVCSYPNPVTGGCSCSSGYTPTLHGVTRATGNEFLWVCTK